MLSSKDWKEVNAEDIRRCIRTVPDWPEPGIRFRDITPLLAHREAFRSLIEMFASRYRNQGIDYVAGIDARGFIVGAVVAHALGVGFLPIRKHGKLPFSTIRESYSLEYGTAIVEIHKDACRTGDRVLLMDDLIATGGTMLAGTKLLQRLGAHVVGCAAIVELTHLSGGTLLREAGFNVYCVCTFGAE